MLFQTRDFTQQQRSANHVPCISSYTHMRATVHCSCDTLAAPQALRCWQAKTSSDEQLWQKVLTHLPLSAFVWQKKVVVVVFPPLKQLCYCGLFILLEGISNPLTRGAWKKSVVFSLQQLWQEQHEKPATGFALSLSCVAIQAHGARTVTNDLKLLNYSIFACCHQFHCLFFIRPIKKDCNIL